MMGVVLVPGLLAAGVGASSSSGWTRGPVRDVLAGGPGHPAVRQPDRAEFLWAIAIGLPAPCSAPPSGGWPWCCSRSSSGELALTPLVGLAVAGLAIAFAEATGKSSSEVLFSGQDALPG